MPDKAKLTTIALIVLIIISLGLAGAGFFFLQKEHAKNLSLQEELDDVKTRQKITEAKLEESKKLIQGLEERLKGSLSQIDSLTKAVQDEKLAKEEALSQIEQFRQDLEQQKSLRLGLETKLNQTQSDTKKMQDQLNTLEAKKSALEAKIKDLEEKSKNIELGKIVVSPQAQEAQTDKASLQKQQVKQPPKKTAKETKLKQPIPALEGKVLVVNKDYSFVVIDLGSKDNVKAGDIFSVSRENKYIGDIKVEKVHESMSAAGFLDELKDKFNEGDKVAQKTK